ncbi:MAG: helix-turn-helix transcriptional regulator, partial [Oscillospiraceae bacterium]|nr:helix-turn-helix transcriptional regulator [Oscillospiraceae bacterium]
MNRLREIRRSKGLNQQAVADAIGINRSSYANYESDRRQADHATLVKLANLFDVSVDYILCRENKQPTDDDGLRAWAIERVQNLSDPALVRVHDFLTGLEAGQEIGGAPAADHDSDAG